MARRSEKTTMKARAVHRAENGKAAGPARKTAATTTRKPPARADRKRPDKGATRANDGSPAPTKAGFVRAQPYDTPARQVVDSAAKLGLIFSPDYVHKVRSATKAAIKLGAPPPSSPGRPMRTQTAPTALPNARAASAASAEVTFRALVFEIGLERARELIRDVERKLGALIGK